MAGRDKTAILTYSFANTAIRAGLSASAFVKKARILKAKSDHDNNAPLPSSLCVEINHPSWHNGTQPDH